MKNIHTPPLPKNKNIMILMALGLLVLFVIVLVLIGDLVKKPRQEKELQSQVASVEAEIEAKRQRLDKSSWDEGVAAAKGEATGQSDDSNFAKQEKRLTSNLMTESEYLKERKWGFWHIVLPLFVVIAIFLYWVAKKHKKWMR